MELKIKVHASTLLDHSRDSLGIARQSSDTLLAASADKPLSDSEMLKKRKI